MKWIRRLALVIAVLICGFVAAAVVTAQRTERPVGFRLVKASAADRHQFAVAIWYPTQASARPTTWLGMGLMSVAPDALAAGNKLPLIVISHGNGGGPASHADLAMALANAGYVVAAPMHAGDNYADQSGLGSASLFNNRNEEVRATIDFMLKKWLPYGQIDPQKIGAYGFSAGGLTVLTAAGAVPDFGKIESHCATTPEFVCKVLRAANSPLQHAGGAKASGPFVADPRIQVAVVAAPGLGFTLAPDGLAAVKIPIQLWSGDQDSMVPYASNTKMVREALGTNAEFHQVAGAGHHAFLVPCGLLAPPALCADQATFDRKAFHREMNASVIAFFDKHVGKR